MTDRIDVLHVDDDPDFADLTATFLEREDDRFRVETASGTAAALDRLEERSFDCVVSDYDMPGTNGLELLEAVREEHPDLPFVLFTGKGSEEVAGEAISAGVTDYIQKEGGTDQYALLANRIGNAVAARRSERAARRRRHRLEQILKTVPTCVVQFDYEGRVVFANDRAEEVLGLEPDAVVGRRYDDPEWEVRGLEGDPVPDTDLPFRRVRDGGEPVHDVEHAVRRPDGTERVLSVNGAPLFDAEGRVDSVVLAVSDVMERHDHERRIEGLHRATRELMAAETEEEVAEVTADVAVNILGFPVNVVRLYREGEGLVPVVVSEEARRLIGSDRPTYRVGQPTAGVAFERGETTVYEDLDDLDDGIEHSPGGGMYVPIGDHGVITVGATEPKTFDDDDVEVAEILAANAEAALNRLERERDG
ncbi:MAG: response regulator [Haloferacaceae archaeon]